MDKNKALKKKYAVRNFKNTTEAIKFMKIVIPFMQKLQDKDIKNAQMETMMELLDEKPLSFVIDTFVFKKVKEGKNKTVRFEEFKDDFQTLFSLFLLAVTELTAKMGGKSQAPKTGQGQIISKRLDP